MSRWDVLVICHPIWWGSMPRIAANFLQNVRLDGKTVIPFVTHAGSGLGSEVSENQKLAPKAVALDGLAVRGTTVDRSGPEIRAWLKRLGF